MSISLGNLSDKNWFSEEEEHHVLGKSRRQKLLCVSAEMASERAVCHTLPLKHYCA